MVAGPSERGVVCAASYEARRFGVRSAMPTARARRLCPQGVFLRPRFPRYEELSERVFDIYRRFTPLVEPLSLDEAFLDVTESEALHGGGRTIALAVKRLVREEVGLTVSAGVADVKLAAKIASDLGKPDGLVEVPAGGARAFLAPLPVGRLWGVGRVTGEAFAKLGNPSHRPARRGTRGAPRRGARPRSRSRPPGACPGGGSSPGRGRRALAQRGRRGDLRARCRGGGGAPASPARAGGAGRPAAPRGGAAGADRHREGEVRRLRARHPPLHAAGWHRRRRRPLHGGAGAARASRPRPADPARRASR